MRIVCFKILILIFLSSVNANCQEIIEDSLSSAKNRYKNYFADEYRSAIKLAQFFFDSLESTGLIKRELEKISDLKDRNKVKNSLRKVILAIDTIINLDASINNTLIHLDNLGGKIQTNNSPILKEQYSLTEKKFEEDFRLIKRIVKKELFLGLGRYVIASENSEIQILLHFWNGMKDRIGNLYKKELEETYNKNRDSLQRKIDSLGIVFDSLGTVFDSLGTVFDFLEKKNVDLSKRNYDLDSTSNARNAENMILQEASVLLIQQNKDLDSSLLKKTKEYLTLEERSENLDSINNSLTQSVDSLKKVIEPLTQEKNTLISEVDSLKAEIPFYTTLANRSYRYTIVAVILFILSLPTILFIVISKRKTEKTNLLLQEQKISLEKKNTDLNSTKEQLQLKTEELDSFIKELHHRIKNNLQVVVGILKRQSRNIIDHNARMSIQDTLNRIRVMGLVHYKLYENNDREVSSINASEFIENIVENVVKINDFGFDVKNRSQFLFDLDDLFLNMDKATDLGLIVNELVSNCFKHAFQNRINNDNHTLEVVLKSGFNPKLTIRDNGPGLPENFSFEETTSFGMKYVADLVKKRKWKINFSSSNKGTAFFVILN